MEIFVGFLIVAYVARIFILILLPYMLDFIEYIHSRKNAAEQDKIVIKKDEGSYPIMNPQTRNITAAITPARIP